MNKENVIMASDPSQYGFLLTPAIKLHRRWFIEMSKLIGIRVKYRYPQNPILDDQGEEVGQQIGVNWTTYAEIDSKYSCPEDIYCIFEQHPDQKTMKKIGWMSELQEGSSIIHVQYDLKNLQYGCLFTLPGGLDDSKGRLFRVVRITNGIIYPASLMCEVVPEYFDKYVPDMNTHESNSNIDVLNNEEYYHTWTQ